MYDIETILVPVDFSRSSRAALALARSLAPNAAAVESFHVADRWPAFMERVLFPYAPLGEDAAAIEHELRLAAEHAISDYHDLSEEASLTVVIGAVKPTIIAQIARSPADLVVAGAFGEAGPMPDTLGSVANRIALSAGRPVILTRDLDPNPKIAKILVALDLTEGSERVFAVAARLALLTGAEIEVLHVVPDPLRDDENKVMRSILKFDRQKSAQMAQGRVEALFERLFRRVEPSFADSAQVGELANRRHVVIGDPALSIITHAQDRGADLVVVGSQSPRRASGHMGRVAATVVRRSPTHVCVVPMATQSASDDDD